MGTLVCPISKRGSNIHGAFVVPKLIMSESTESLLPGSGKANSSRPEMSLDSSGCEVSIPSKRESVGCVDTNAVVALLGTSSVLVSVGIRVLLSRVSVDREVSMDTRVSVDTGVLVA